MGLQLVSIKSYFNDPTNIKFSSECLFLEFESGSSVYSQLKEFKIVYRKFCLIIVNFEPN